MARPAHVESIVDTNAQTYKKLNTHTQTTYTLTQYEQLRKSGKMMGMYVNRVNGGWAEARKWGPPDVASCSNVSIWAKSDQFAIYKADVM